MDILEQLLYTSAGTGASTPGTFEYDVPTGLPTANNKRTKRIMAYSTIPKSSSYFNPKAYTGTGSSNALTGVGFEPSFTWIKSRSNSYSHTLTDAVRGVTKHNASNNSNVEYTSTTEITSFDSDGFTVGTNGVNNDSDTFASWNCKGAGTSCTNDATGSGTS